MRKTIILLVISSLVLGGLGAVATPNENTKKYEELKVSFSQPQIIQKGDFVEITLSEANSYLINEGKPLLPSYIHTFTFPKNTIIKSIDVNQENIKTKTINRDILSSPEKAILGTVIQEKSQNYILENTYPVTDYKYEIKAGINGLNVIVEVYPTNYNQEQKTINWAEQIDITVEYEPGSDIQTTNADTDFIILTADEFSDELQSLKTHKITEGLTTEIYTLSQIKSQAQGRDDAEKVKYFIKDAVENWGTTNVMLVGNKDKFPVRETHIKAHNSDNEIFLSDLYFADLYYYNEQTQQTEFVSWDSNENDVFAEYNWNGNNDIIDYLPDIRVGRLAANDAGEVTAVVNKIIEYETGIAYTKDWFTNLVAVGGDSFPGDEDLALEGEVVNNEVADIMEGFIPDFLQVSNGRIDTTNFNGVREISDAIKSGCGFVDFSGHGNTYVWATHPYENDNKWLPNPVGGYLTDEIEKLNNGDKLPIIITGACSVSKFSKDKYTFSWTFVSNDNGGAIASYGATALGWAYTGNWVTYGLVEGMAIRTFEAYKDGAITIGEMWERALNDYINTISDKEGTDYKTILEWELFGDPTLKIAAESTPPEKPSRPSGPVKPSIKTSNTYTATTTDVDGDEIYYLFEWGDGTFSGWKGPYSSGQEGSASHKYSKEGSFSIRVKAKDEHGVQSPWSDPLPIQSPKNINLPILNRLQQNYPIIYQILQKIFNI